MVWASWDIDMIQGFPAHPLPVALWNQTSVGCVFYRAGMRQGRGAMWELGEGSTSGAWLWVCAEQGKNVTMYLNHWLLWVISMFSFLHEVWKFSSSKKCIYLTTKGLTTHSQGGDSSSVAESQLTQGKSRGDWWKWEPLDTGGVWWLLTVGKQVTLHHLCESHLHFGRKLMEGKADTSGKSDLMEVMV